MQPSHKVWLAAHGPGPWPCTFCGDPVPKLGGRGRKGPPAGVIHHDDHNHGNDAITNLRAAHYICHLRYHGRTRRLSRTRG